MVRDAIVRLGGPDAPPMSHAVRLVEVQVNPQPRRTRKARAGVLKGGRHSDRLLIVSDMTDDLAAELTALIYQHRYSVELFFRFLKQVLGLRGT